MTTREQVWMSFASGVLGAMLMGRQLPLRPDEDGHFSADLAAMSAKFADAAVNEWERRFNSRPKHQRTRNPKESR